MIISASRRTDIPAFYADWFMNRIRAGFALVRNPFNARQLRRVSLAVEDVDAIVFWTRNAEKLIPHLPELDARGYRYYFQYTITGYPPPLEKSTPRMAQAVRTFSRLSDLIGPERVLWRYDPILPGHFVSPGEHRERFEAIASALSGRTPRITTSVAEPYRKTRRNLDCIAGPAAAGLARDPAQLRELVGDLARIAARHGMEMRTCATVLDLTDIGVSPGKCIDEQRLKTEFGIDYPSFRDKGQRPACLCVKSIDIGQYDTCVHGCAYCYATRDMRKAAGNKARHDPDNPVLIGSPEQVPS